MQIQKFHDVIISLKVHGETAAKHQVSTQSAINLQKCLCSNGINISLLFCKEG